MELFDRRYEKVAPIGRGAFSEVWQAIDTQTGVTLALKIFTIDQDMDEEGMKMLTREFALMIDADHHNLLRPLYFGISNDESRQPYLTMPFCKSGNIYKMIGQMTEHETWKLIRDTASALTYLHTMNPPIIHQDIKPANILIGNDGYYKLSDFGVSIHAKSTFRSMPANEIALSSAGTISYMAPEKFSRDTRPIMANDIWSLGAMVYEMIDGNLPFGNDGGLLQKKGADIPQIHGDFSQLLMQTLDSCLSPEPWNRPLASQLEEIANNALLKAPTPPESVTPTLSTGPTEITNSNGSKKIIIMAAIITSLLIIGISIYFLLKPSPIEPAIEADNLRPPATKEVRIPKQEVAEPPLEETQKQLPEPKEQVKEVSTTESKPKHGNLSYGLWNGKLSGGKPIGIGSLTFTSSASIHCTNGKVISPQAGDKINNAEFDENGYLYQGTWIKSDGQTKNIIP